mgnify:CR=1 FL=1
MALAISIFERLASKVEISKNTFEQIEQLKNKTVEELAQLKEEKRGLELDFERDSQPLIGDIDVLISAIKKTRKALDETTMDSVIQEYKRLIHDSITTVGKKSDFVEFLEEVKKINNDNTAQTKKLSGDCKDTYRRLHNKWTELPSLQPHIFEEFTREHSSTESHITGTGLGLPIVKSLVNLMGGTIDVESELGAGTITTVCLTFGLPTEEQLAAHQHKDEILGQSLQTLSEKRVLLAEDNDLNAEIVLTVLEENGIHAKHVKDGALCLKAVQNAPEDYYDVILMDIQMPNMNGYQAAEAIRALPGKRGEIPIVAMTANAFEEDRRKALESGMNAHIAKPVDVSVLLETLSRFS